MVVAQLVERRVVVADVAGSSPVSHPSPLGGIGRRDALKMRCRETCEFESRRGHLCSPGGTGRRCALKMRYSVECTGSIPVGSTHF